MGRKQSCNSLSSDLAVSSHMDDFVCNGFPWISLSWTDSITCWTLCHEARSSTAEYLLQEDPLRFVLNLPPTSLTWCLPSLSFPAWSAERKNKILPGNGVNWGDDLLSHTPVENFPHGTSKPWWDEFTEVHWLGSETTTCRDWCVCDNTWARLGWYN